MSFKKYSDQQITLNDSFLNQTPRTQKIIRNSWAGDFADIVFPAIDEGRFSVLYSDNQASRPNTPVNVIIGALMLKECNGLNDDELLESICCDVRYQYALHTTQLEEQPVSDRTFSRFRARVYQYELETGKNLLEEEMMHLASVYQEYMDLHSDIKRMDSLMIASRCKRMSRLEIIYQTTSNAVRLIHRLGCDELLSGDLLHYLEEDDHNKVIYYCKGEDVTPRLEKALKEAAAAKAIMADDSWHGFSEYQLLVRVLMEQGTSDDPEKIGAKPNREISAASLQNPSDPDATYRKKAGKDHKGYVGNIVETVGENGDSLITDVAYENNSHSDSDFCKEYLEKRPEDAGHEVMIADGAYNSQENQDMAAAKDVDLMPTALTGRQPNLLAADFKFNADGTKVLECPMGHAPEKSAYYPKTGTCRARFSKNCCEDCPHREDCQCKPQKKSFAVYVSAGTAARAEQAKKMTTEGYISLARKRNAVEGIMSVLRRKYRIDSIPVSGHLRSRLFFLFKIGAYNFNKLRKHNAQTRAKSAQNLEFA